MRVATDIGGTFTDLVYISENGEIQTCKAHTTPNEYEQGVLAVLKKSQIETEAITSFIHGSTVVINTLTERKGIKTGLITTKGFKDVLEIARGNRPDLYNFRYKKPEPFIERHLRYEVSERINFKGDIETPLDEEAIRQAVNDFHNEGVEAIAISFLHSYKNPAHEKRALQLIKQMNPDISVTASFELTREWREYERTNTAALNAYVKPIANSYINKLQAELENEKITAQKLIMQSNGGSASFNKMKELPINMVESGPVGGIYGASVLGKMIGEKNIIAFDIGGTTAKCSLIENGEVKITTDYYIEKNSKSAGYPIKVPVVDIVEIGNGGGSIAWVDELGSLKVGPQSAGAAPGPVAYGKGGVQPTTTDANLILGRLSLENFEDASSINDVRGAMEKFVAEPLNIEVDDAALGVVRIANSNMLNALKLVSIRKGHDPRDFTMIAFGGGGSMHAASLAKELNIKKLVIPVGSSVFSAWGMLMTDLRQDYLQTYIRKLKDIDKNEWESIWGELEKSAVNDFEEDGFDSEHVQFNYFADMRYTGQEHTVKVPIQKENLSMSYTEFHQLHEQMYSFMLVDTEIEIVNLHLAAFYPTKQQQMPQLKITGRTIEDALKAHRDVLFENNGWLNIPVYDRELLEPNMTAKGPLIVEEPSATTVVYPEQTMTVDKLGNLIIEMEAPFNE